MDIMPRFNHRDLSQKPLVSSGNGAAGTSSDTHYATGAAELSWAGWLCTMVFDISLHCIISKLSDFSEILQASLQTFNIFFSTEVSQSHFCYLYLNILIDSLRQHSINIMVKKAVIRFNSNVRGAVWNKSKVR